MSARFRPTAFRRLLLLGTSLAWAAVCWAQTPLRTALEVRSLPPEEAEKQLPVELEGTVIFVEVPIGSVLIQDHTAGTFFRGPNLGALRAGDVVAVKGVTMPGLYLPGLEKATYVKLGHRETPPGTPATYSDLLFGRYHYQLVSVEGIVQAVTADGDETRTTLVLGMDQNLLEVRVYAPLGEGRPLVDSRVRIEGLAAGTINHRRQLVQPILWVQDWDRVQVVKPAPAMEEVPAISASRLLAFEPVGHGGHRVRVAGTVLAAFPDGAVFIRDGTMAVSLQLEPPVSLSEGSQIEVVGFPRMQRFSAALANAEIVRQEPGPAPAATAANLGNLQDGRHDKDLITVAAALTGMFRADEGHVLVLEEKGRTLRVQAPLLEPEPPLGARLRVTGICQVESVVTETTGMQSRPRTVSLRCRDAGDLTVLQAPSWWTTRRLAMMVAVLLLTVGLAALWIMLLQRQVLRQTAALRRRIEREATLEERQRIAREFHDTLEQGLTGLLLRLEAVQARGVDETCAALVRASRGLVSQMQVETRSMVSDLREPPDEGADLVAALRALVEEHPPGCGPLLKLETPAALPPLPSRTVHHLRMIAREAVTNALKHAGAANIRLALEVKRESLRLLIADDGQGFDGNATRGEKAGHFGCVGIEERCEKLGAAVRWHSAPGQGTIVEIELPLAAAPIARLKSAAPLLLNS